jgi:DNA-binding transcriptional ArsR family regulator
MYSHGFCFSQHIQIIYLYIDISENTDIIFLMNINPVKVFKALSSETRLQILEWLKEPKRNFGSFVRNKDTCGDMDEVGACVSVIQLKCGLSQSTVSQFLAMLQDAELIIATRLGQWTYYKRNEKSIAQLAKYIGKKL